MKATNLLPALALCFLGTILSAQEPHLTNAKVEELAAAKSLETAVRDLAREQREPAWIGYAVPIVPGNRRICCGSSDDSHLPPSLRHGVCKLENRDDGINFQDNKEDQESPQWLIVMLRVENQKVVKLRIFTEDCQLDAGGRTVHWLTGVPSAQSVAFLAGFVLSPADTDRISKRLADEALGAVALHQDEAADQALARLTEASQPEEVRRNAAFWLGNARGVPGCERLHAMMREDPSSKVREQVTFAYSISPAPDAMGYLIDAAHRDTSREVRSQALFWLSQKAGEKAMSAIADAIENDPETEVKKKAVFALSQLPRGEGVPRLISVAKTNRNREVRKDAMFWLGQSHDDRALAFFEDVLAH